MAAEFPEHFYPIYIEAVYILWTRGYWILCTIRTYRGWRGE